MSANFCKHQADFRKYQAAANVFESASQPRGSSHGDPATGIQLMEHLTAKGVQLITPQPQTTTDPSPTNRPEHTAHSSHSNYRLHPSTCPAPAMTCPAPAMPEVDRFCSWCAEACRGVQRRAEACRGVHMAGVQLSSLIAPVASACQIRFFAQEPAGPRRPSVGTCTRHLQIGPRSDVELTAPSC